MYRFTILTKYVKPLRYIVRKNLNKGEDGYKLQRTLSGIEEIHPETLRTYHLQKNRSSLQEPLQDTRIHKMMSAERVSCPVYKIQESIPEEHISKEKYQKCFWKE